MADPKPDAAGFAELRAQLRLQDQRIRDLESPSGTQRAQTVRSTPFLDFRNARTSGFGIDGSWQTYASVDVPIPEGRNFARVLAIAEASVTDMTTGGVTTSAARVVIAGDMSGEFPASKDAAATRVINVLHGVHTITVPVVSGELLNVQVQLKALNPNAYTANAANFALIAALVSFTYQEA